MEAGEAADLWSDPALQPRYAGLPQEDDGRWIAEIPGIPGLLAYDVTPLQAGAKAKALALRVLAERMENEVSLPSINSVEFVKHWKDPVILIMFFLFTMAMK